jgi:hypothetical protein
MPTSWVARIGTNFPVKEFKDQPIITHIISE